MREILEVSCCILQKLQASLRAGMALIALYNRGANSLIIPCPAR
jgi:hypothetical protein